MTTELLTRLEVHAGLYPITLETFYQGGDKLSYKMVWGGHELFSGDDFKPSPMRDIDSIDASLDLLSFLCAQPGDVDSEYFAAYTPAQMTWAISRDCELLKGIVSDAGDSNGDYYTEAIASFNHEIM